MTAYRVGIDGGGTRTTLALADAGGREVLRRTGPAGLVDPRDPAVAVELLVRLVRDLLGAAGVEPPVSVLCAGLAGVGDAATREIVRAGLERAGVAERVIVVTDGEIALEGALGGAAGVLLVAGTGSIAYGRAEDGRVERCGGWGMVAGDEGSGYWMGRAALAHALRAYDGRGSATSLLPALLEDLGLSGPEPLPTWAGRAAKGEIASLSAAVLRCAEDGDAVSEDIVREAARDLAAHAGALIRRLGPWSAPTAVVLHGGVARHPAYVRAVREALNALRLPLGVREPEADAVAGAVGMGGRSTA